MNLYIILEFPDLMLYGEGVGHSLQAVSITKEESKSIQQFGNQYGVPRTTDWAVDRGVEHAFSWDVHNKTAIAAFLLRWKTDGQ